MSVDDFVELFKTRWNYFVQAAATIGTAVGAFLAPPPISATTFDWYHFGNFLLGVLLALWFVPMSAWSARRHAWRWWLVALITAVCGVFALFRYQAARDAWTVGYGGTRLVHGSVMLLRAKQYRAAHSGVGLPPMTDSTMLMDSGGDVDDVWDARDREYRARVLGTGYLLVLALFGSLLVMAVQAVYCIVQDDSPTRQARTPVSPPDPRPPVPAANGGRVGA
jgi:hypothetical protein